jgi:hypothetical protein
MRAELCAQLSAILLIAAGVDSMVFFTLPNGNSLKKVASVVSNGWSFDLLLLSSCKAEFISNGFFWVN